MYYAEEKPFASIYIYQVVAGLYTHKVFINNYFKIFPIMLNAFRELLYSKLCWHNRPEPNHDVPSGN